MDNTNLNSRGYLDWAFEICMNNFNFREHFFTTEENIYFLQILGTEIDFFNVGEMVAPVSNNATIVGSS